jgi:hypothetical protein
VIRSPLSIAAGEARSFAVAGVRVTFVNEVSSGGAIRLPVSYQPFLTRESTDIEIRVASRDQLDPSCGALLYESNLHWRAVSTGRNTVFQFHHPPTALLYCEATVPPDFSRVEIMFSEASWRAFAPSGAESWEIPYPLDQLLLVPALALRGAVLLHACGAVVSNRGMVFAGHSGDGKTTLAGLLASEGTPLLSDERIAVRKTERGFVAFGTPWPGEGNVVSNASSPLSGMFVLRKATHHALSGRSPSLAADLLARAIVPYYLPDVATRILGIFSELASEVPFRELHFARSSGITALLREAA